MGIRSLRGARSRFLPGWPFLRASAPAVVAFVAAGVGVANSGTAFSTGAVSVDAGQTIIGFVANESRAAIVAASDTTNGSWSAAQTALADTGATNTSQEIVGQSKLATGSGNQSYDTSTGAARDYATSYIILSGASSVTDLASANSVVSGATLASTASAAVGDFLVIGIAADNAGAAGAASISGVTDSAGNTWTQRQILNRTAAAGVSDGTTLGIFTCLVTAALVAGTITVAFVPDTTAKAAIVKKAVV